MTTSACTFSAKPGPLYSNYTTVSAQPGCCTKSGAGDVSICYGLNNTCHVLKYEGDAAPYTLTVLEKNAGNLSLTTGQCDVLLMRLQSSGQYSTGDGNGPSDAGLATKYGYTGCVVGASTNANEASSKKATTSAAGSSTREARRLLLLAAVLPFFML